VWPTLALGNELNPAWVSHDRAVVEAYASDPLIFHTTTPRWFTEMNAAWGRVHAAARFPTPFGMFVGDADPITDAAVNQAFARKHGAELQVYSGFLHEILNEIGRERPIADIAAFLEH
jgi:alpha-beta hydrolase superfamily lysophospholipase